MKEQQHPRPTQDTATERKPNMHQKPKVNSFKLLNILPGFLKAAHTYRKPHLKLDVFFHYTVMLFI